MRLIRTHAVKRQCSLLFGRFASALACGHRSLSRNLVSGPLCHRQNVQTYGTLLQLLSQLKASFVVSNKPHKRADMAQVYEQRSDLRSRCRCASTI